MTMGTTGPEYIPSKEERRRNRERARAQGKASASPVAAQPDTAVADPAAAAAEVPSDRGATPTPTEEPAEPREETETASTNLLDQLPEKTRKHLEPQLHEAEEAIAVIKGASAQAIVAFETRLFVVKPGFMAGSTFGARVTSFDYRNITAIEVNKKLTTAVIEVIAAGYEGRNPTRYWSSKEGQDPYKISNCLPLGRQAADKAEPTLALIRKRINDLQNPTSPQIPVTLSGGIADELGKLAQLRDQGILSEDEFDAAKKRLLSS